MYNIGRYLCISAMQATRVLRLAYGFILDVLRPATSGVVRAIKKADTASVVLSHGRQWHMFGT